MCEGPKRNRTSRNNIRTSERRLNWAVNWSLRTERYESIFVYFFFDTPRQSRRQGSIKRIYRVHRRLCNRCSTRYRRGLRVTFRDERESAKSEPLWKLFFLVLRKDARTADEYESPSGVARMRKIYYTNVQRSAR